MIQFRFRIDRKVLESLDRIVDEAAAEGLEDSMKLVRITAQYYAPRRTGDLEDSIEAGVNQEGRRLIGWVGSDLDYARIHEFGGVTGEGGRITITAKHYMGRAIVDCLSEIENNIEDVFARKMRRT